MSRRTFSIVAAAAAVALVTGCAAPRPAAPVAVKVLAINDFHGNLEPPLGGIRIQDPADRSRTIDVPAGGAEHLATAISTLRAKNPNHIFVAAGDLIGATPLLSALFNDEPTIDALGLMGLEVTAVGNHEFDHGAAELLRLQRGGCKPDGGCKGPVPFTGAKFQYLAASTVDTRTGQTLFPAYHVKRFQGIPVAFIGLALKGTPNIVMASGVAGLEFRDEVETVNALVPQLRAQGIEAIVVLIHEGGFPTGGYNECPGISGPIVAIVEQLDPAVDLVVSGHTHRAYNCRIGGRLVTSADKYGTLVTEIDLKLDPATGDVIETRADNLIVRTDTYAKDPQQTRLLAAYAQVAAPLAQRVVGKLAAPLTRDANPAGETPLGKVVADAQLAATRGAAAGGAQIAMVNPGGIRAGLAPRPDGTVRYEDLFAVQPFYNNLVTLTLTGRQLQAVLEQQWQNQPQPRVLQVSRGFSYRWDAAAPVGQRVVADSLRVDGEPVLPERRYRVTVNSFLAGGGDGFSVFKQGTEPHTGMMDIDAFDEYFKGRPDVQSDAAPRVLRAN